MHALIRHWYEKLCQVLSAVPTWASGRRDPADVVEMIRERARSEQQPDSEKADLLLWFLGVSYTDAEVWHVRDWELAVDVALQDKPFRFTSTASRAIVRQLLRRSGIEITLSDRHLRRILGS